MCVPVFLLSFFLFSKIFNIATAPKFLRSDYNSSADITVHSFGLKLCLLNGKEQIAVN